VFDGLAIDVGRQKLYYADADQTVGKVGEMSTDGANSTVLSRNAGSQPRALVLDVSNRCAFFAVSSIILLYEIVLEGQTNMVTNKQYDYMDDRELADTTLTQQ